MTRTARTLWLILILNVAMSAGVLIYGLGDVPWNELKDAFRWFCAGAFVSGVALSFAYVTGMDVPGETPRLDDASPRAAGWIWRVISGAALGLVLFVVGLIETVSMLAG